MIPYNQIQKLFAFDPEKKYCVEILFLLSGSEKFSCCWMGKLYDNQKSRDLYWYGLTPDGRYAFEYDSFEEMAADPAFDGLSLAEVWDRVEILEIDGCPAKERLGAYLGRI